MFKCAHFCHRLICLLHIVKRHKTTQLHFQTLYTVTLISQSLFYYEVAFLTMLSGKMEQIWLGGTDRHDEGNWIWEATGDKFVYYFDSVSCVGITTASNIILCWNSSGGSVSLIIADFLHFLVCVCVRACSVIVMITWF